MTNDGRFYQLVTNNQRHHDILSCRQRTRPLRARRHPCLQLPSPPQAGYPVLLILPKILGKLTKRDTAHICASAILCHGTLLLHQFRLSILNYKRQNIIRTCISTYTLRSCGLMIHKANRNNCFLCSWHMFC